MVCNKCGADNPKGALICMRCGSQLDESGFDKILENIEQENASPGSTTFNGKGQTLENKLYQPSDETKVRKAIKKASKKKPKWEIMTAILIIVSVVIFSGIIIFNVTLDSLKNLGDLAALFIIIPIFMLAAVPVWALILIFILVFLFNLFMGFGIKGAALNINRGETPKISDVFLSPFKSFRNIIFYYIFTILINISVTLLFKIPFIGMIIAIIYLILFIYYWPVVSIMKVMCVDNEYRSSGPFSFFKEADELLRGRRIKYYAMVFSFLPWYLLSILTFGILFIWVIPYFTLAQTNLYRYWLYEEEYEEKPCFSDGFVVFLTILFVGVTLFTLSYISIKISDQQELERSIGYSANNTCGELEHQYLNAEYSGQLTQTKGVIVYDFSKDTPQYGINMKNNKYYTITPMSGTAVIDLDKREVNCYDLVYERAKNISCSTNSKGEFKCKKIK